MWGLNSTPFPVCMPLRIGIFFPPLFSVNCPRYGRVCALFAMFCTRLLCTTEILTPVCCVFAGYAESCVNEGEIVNVLTIKNMMCYTCMCKVSTRAYAVFNQIELNKKIEFYTNPI